MSLGVKGLNNKIPAKTKLNFYVCTVQQLDTVRVYCSPTNAQVIVLKTMLKFTLK
jgi:hypothetical protein